MSNVLWSFAQATIYLAVAPKSNRSGTAYGAAMADVVGRGSLPVPNHLRNAGDRRMKTHGIGVGYRYPHEYEGSDVEQQYLPDELADRRYYVPSPEGSEARIGDLMLARRERRAAGKPGRVPPPPGNGMSGVSDGMKANTESRRKLAQVQRQDADG